MNDTDPMTLNDQIADAIRHRLIDLDLTQIDLGRQLFPGSARPGNIVSQYARGARGGMSDNLERILQALGAQRITIDWGPATDPRFDTLIDEALIAGYTHGHAPEEAPAEAQPLSGHRGGIILAEGERTRYALHGDAITANGIPILHLTRQEAPT